MLYSLSPDEAVDHDLQGEDDEADPAAAQEEGREVPVVQGFLQEGSKKSAARIMRSS